MSAKKCESKKMSAKKRKKRDKKYPKGYPLILIEHEETLRKVRKKDSNASPQEKQRLLNSAMKLVTGDE